MATNLPTLSLDDAQAARCLAAFGDAAAYRKWLRRQVADYVIRYENSTRAQALQADLDKNTEDTLVALGVKAAPAAPAGPPPDLTNPTPPPA